MNPTSPSRIQTPPRVRLPASPFAFTLLEVMLAMAMLAIIGVTIYRLTLTAATAATATIKQGEEERACTGLTRLLQAQLNALPSQTPGALIGIARQAESDPDQLQMLCAPGNGVLSSNGDYSLYRCILRLRREKSANAAAGGELGIERAPYLVDAKLSAEQGWLPLIPGVNGLEISYFNSRLNDWVAKWNDFYNLPDLVRVRLTFADGRRPYETLLRVTARVRRPGAPAPALTNTPPTLPPNLRPPPPLPPNIQIPQLPPNLRPLSQPPELRQPASTLTR